MRPQTAVTSLAAAGVAALTWGTLLERQWFVLRRHQVPCLAAGSAPIRLLHVSDLHLMPGQARKARWVADLARLQPDLVVTTGDNIASARSLDRLREAYGPLLEVPGAFVLGSNDYFAPHLKNPFTYFSGPSKLRDEEVPLPTDELVALLTSGGWRDLTNRRDTVTLRDGRTLELVGVDDPHLQRDVMPPAATTSRQDAVLRLGVAHAPYLRVLDAFAADGCDLALAGHTHGGQVCVPGLGALVTNCDLDRGRVSGLHPYAGTHGHPATSGQHPMWLHVSAGLGTSPYAPVRFACRPEATLLELVASTPEG